MLPTTDKIIGLRSIANGVKGFRMTGRHFGRDFPASPYLSMSLEPGWLVSGKQKKIKMKAALAKIASPRCTTLHDQWCATIPVHRAKVVLENFKTGQTWNGRRNCKSKKTNLKECEGRVRCLSDIFESEKTLHRNKSLKLLPSPPVYKCRL